MKDKITQLIQIITLLCEKRSNNEEEAAHNKIEHINNNKLQSIKEMEEITFAHPLQSNRIEKTVKEKEKLIEATQDKERELRTVDFCEKCVEAMNISNKKSKMKITTFEVISN